MQKFSASLVKVLYFITFIILAFFSKKLLARLFLYPSRFIDTQKYLGHFFSKFKCKQALKSADKICLQHLAPKKFGTYIYIRPKFLWSDLI